MKKMLTMLLVLVLVVGTMAGCGSEEPTPAASEETKTYKVAMICDSTIADGGWGAACYNAMISAAGQVDFETQYTDGLNSSDFASTMRSYADLGFDLIFAPGNQYSDAVKEVAADYPDVYFALLNGAVETDNITSLLPDAEQIGYMAGALAGLMTETNSLGFIGGMELDTTKMKMSSFEAAAKAVNPDAETFIAYAGSFSDTAKGKEIAESMISLNNVDVFYGDASAVDSGVREVLTEYEGKYDIGQPSDLMAIAPSDVVIGSVVTDNATMIRICMEDVMNSSYGNKTIYGNLENGALSVGTFNDDLVSEELQEEYLAIIDKIADGSFISE